MQPVAQGPDNDGAYGWSCGAAVSFDGYSGYLGRNYGQGNELSPYVMEAREAGSTDPNRHRITWTVYPLAEGPPPSRRPNFLGGRREAGLFATGPDYVHISFLWHTQVTGPVWAYYWGDGHYAGVEMLMSARNTRRFRDRDGLLGGISGGLSDRALLTALADARSWTVVAIDATGKRLFQETFAVPDRQRVEAEYRRARAALDRVEARFRATHAPLSEDGVACEDAEDPAASI